LSSDAYACGQNASSLYNTTANMQKYQHNLDEYLNRIVDIPSTINSKTDLLTNYGTTYKNDSVWILYAIVLLVIFSFEFGLCYSNKRMLQLSIAFSQLLLLALIVVCAAEMVLVVRNIMSFTINLITFVCLFTYLDGNI
jgi:endoglucanase Acf2